MSPTFPEAGLVLQLSVLGGRRNRILHLADQGPSFDDVDMFKPVCLRRMGPIKRGRRLNLRTGKATVRRPTKWSETSNQLGGAAKEVQEGASSHKIVGKAYRFTKICLGAPETKRNEGTLIWPRLTTELCLSVRED